MPEAHSRIQMSVCGVTDHRLHTNADATCLSSAHTPQSVNASQTALPTLSQSGLLSCIAPCNSARFFLLHDAGIANLQYTFSCTGPVIVFHRGAASINAALIATLYACTGCDFGKYNLPRPPIVLTLCRGCATGSPGTMKNRSVLKIRPPALCVSQVMRPWNAPRCRLCSHVPLLPDLVRPFPLNLQTPLPDLLRCRVCSAWSLRVGIDGVCRCPDLPAVPQRDHVRHSAVFQLDDRGNLASLPHAITFSHQHTLTQSPDSV